MVSILFVMLQLTGPARMCILIHGLHACMPALYPYMTVCAITIIIIVTLLKPTTCFHFQVNTNGALSFDESYDQFRTDEFPFAGPPLIAPFWSDIDTGEVYYRLTNDTTVTTTVEAELGRAFPDYREITPNVIFVATWSNVGYYFSPSNEVFEKGLEWDYTHYTYPYI